MSIARPRLPSSSSSAASSTRSPTIRSSTAPPATQPRSSSPQRWLSRASSKSRHLHRNRRDRQPQRQLVNDLVVHHFGPDPATVGGMASVIRVFTEHNVGGDTVHAHPS